MLSARTAPQEALRNSQVQQHKGLSKDEIFSHPLHARPRAQRTAGTLLKVTEKIDGELTGLQPSPFYHTSPSPLGFSLQPLKKQPLHRCSTELLRLRGNKRYSWQLFPLPHATEGSFSKSAHEQLVEGST